jgi:hypothetical protein
MTRKLAAEGFFIASLLAIVGSGISCVPSTQNDAFHSSRATSDVLTREELNAETHVDLLEAVRRLRPRWLRQRGANIERGRPIVVYQGDVYAGMIDHLRSIPIELVAEMRFYDRYTAAVRWGREDVAGVIQVIAR